MWDLEKTTGIGAISGNQIIATIYPNPVVDQLFIRLNNQKIFKAIIADLTGKEVLQHTINDYEANINLGDLVGGYYLLILDLNEKRQVTKIYKK